MKAIFFIIISFFVLNASFVNGFRTNSLARWVVEKNSSLSIQGETNINSFQCDVTEYLRPDTLVYSKNDATRKLSFSNSCLAIDIRRFDCHSKYITEDFRSALKADDNPNLKIIFISIDQFSSSCSSETVRGIVDIELANVRKRAEICYTIKTLSPNRIQMVGSQVFSFSDFHLKAPRKLAGLIRTKEKITVNFQLFFKSI